MNPLIHSICDVCIAGFCLAFTTLYIRNIYKNRK